MTDVNKKDFITWMLFICLAISILWSNYDGKIEQKHRDAKQEAILQETKKTHEDFKMGMVFIDKYQQANEKSFYLLGEQIKMVNKYERISKELIKNYEPEYEKIKNTVGDSAQLVITDSLLARHRRIKFERY